MEDMPIQSLEHMEQMEGMDPMSAMVLQSPPTVTRTRKRKSAEENSIVKLSRKRTPKLTIYDKVRIILASKNEKKSYREIREIYRCSKSTISAIMEKSSQILEKAGTLTEIQSKQRCRIKQEAHYPEIEKGLFLWLNHPNIKVQKVTDKQIRDKAKEEFFRAYGKEWKPSAGWLVGFKARCKKKDFLNTVSPEIAHNAFGIGNEPETKPARWIEKMKERTLQMQNLVLAKQEEQNAQANIEYNNTSEVQAQEYLNHQQHQAYPDYPSIFANAPRQQVLQGMLPNEEESSDED